MLAVAGLILHYLTLGANTYFTFKQALAELAAEDKCISLDLSETRPAPSRENTFCASARESTDQDDKCSALKPPATHTAQSFNLSAETRTAPSRESTFCDEDDTFCAKKKLPATHATLSLGPAALIGDHASEMSGALLYWHKSTNTA